VLPREARHRQRARRPAVRSLSRSLPALGAACLTLLLAGCGADDGETPPGGETIELEVTLDRDGRGGGPEQSERISCEIDSGCNQAAEELARSDFEPVPADAICTEIFGGPDTATIQGTLDGERVEAELSRANGCEIERFDRFLPLLTELFPAYRPGAALRPPESQ